MPRKPAVSHAEMAAAIALAKDGILGQDSSILGPSANIWQQVALKLDNKVTPRYVYQYVKQDRHDIHRALGLSPSASSPVYSTSPFSEMDVVFDTDEEVEVEHIVQPEKTFIITFTPAEWRIIQPVETKYKRKDRVGTRVRMVLPQNCWANMLVEKLWECHKLPCPYTMTRGHVTSGEDKEYINIAALCKECGASATGVILLKPLEGESVSLSWRAPDTRKVPHRRSRWLSGTERIKVGKDLKRNCASVLRRELAFLKMDQGDLKPPTLWPNSVLRKAKQEYREKELGTQGHSSPVESLVSMKYSSRYAGIIHDIGIDKFFIHYYSVAQLLLYKKHCRANFTKLSIDATGTLVKKITNKVPDHKSGHIFLYESIMTSVPKCGPPQHVPACQMLSEKHDANSLIYWLNEWRRAGAPVPNEVVVDNSAALKSAVARVFLGLDLKTYIADCFVYLMEGKGNLPKTYLRLDVAHYINAACRWRIWADRNNKRVKEFYIRCLGTLINAQTLPIFEERLQDILSVAISPCQADSAGDAFPMVESLSRLSKVIKKGSESDVQVADAAETSNSDESRLADDGDELTPKVEEWITKIKNSIQVTDDPEGQLNPYHLPEVANEFCRMAREFILWSSVMVRDFGSPFLRGTSSPVESAFSDLKCNILKGESKPLKVDNFVATHINAIEGACRIADTTFDGVNIDTHKTEIPDTAKNDSAADALNHIENWRGLGVSVPKKSKYLSAFPGAEVAITSNTYKPVTQGLLLSGSGKAVTTPDGTVLLVSNTCPFDALCHLITNAYLTFESYRDQMTKSDNGLILTAKSLAQDGTTNATYIKRAETLAAVLEPQSQLNMPITRRRTLGLQYDAYGNVSNLLKKMIPPHTSQQVMCEVENHKKYIMVIDPNSKTLVKEGIVSLNKSIEEYKLPCTSCVSHYGDHIFVDVEFLSDKLFPRNDSPPARLYSLEELPKQLSLGDNTYKLSGAVAYEGNHYVAYCTCLSVWRKYDDQSTKEYAVNETMTI